jgi:hypothetical protein
MAQAAEKHMTLSIKGDVWHLLGEHGKLKLSKLHPESDRLNPLSQRKAGPIAFEWLGQNFLDKLDGLHNRMEHRFEASVLTTITRNSYDSTSFVPFFTEKILAVSETEDEYWSVLACIYIE